MLNKAQLSTASAKYVNVLTQIKMKPASCTVRSLCPFPWEAITWPMSLVKVLCSTAPHGTVSNPYVALAAIFRKHAGESETSTIFQKCARWCRVQSCLSSEHLLTEPTLGTMRMHVDRTNSREAQMRPRTAGGRGSGEGKSGHLSG